MVIFLNIGKQYYYLEVICVKEFKLEKSHASNVIKSIRFSEELNEKICKVVEEANKGKPVKQYSFNGFVCSACEFALEHLSEELKTEECNTCV